MKNKWTKNFGWIIAVLMICDMFHMIHRIPDGMYKRLLLNEKSDKQRQERNLLIIEKQQKQIDFLYDYVQHHYHPH